MIMMNIKTEESGSFFEQTDVSSHLLPFPVKLPTEDDLPCDDGEPIGSVSGKVICADALYQPESIGANKKYA